ncbi:MAG TPA: hypothetical protein VND02_04880 [Actinomycetota bacterium]|jgi:hypothetical protein|nr:hypothetical protein [Actinomycetota bacterium]
MVTGARASITERDLQVLRFAGEQYAVPMAVVGQLVDVGAEPLAPGSVATVARRAVGRLEQLGYAGRRPLLGQQWLIPTRTGLRAAGLDYRAEVPAESLLRHVATVARLRLHLAGAYPDGEWESERSIRRQWGDTRVRRVDGALWWPNEDATGVEVERHLKKLPRYQGIVHDLDPNWNAGVWWFTPLELVPLLAARLREAGGGDFHQVYPLPEGVAL